MMLYRDFYYFKNQFGGAEEGTSSDADRKRITEAKQRLEASRGITEVIIDKNLKGPTETVKLLFDGATTSFKRFSMKAGA